MVAVSVYFVHNDRSEEYEESFRWAKATGLSTTCVLEPISSNLYYEKEIFAFKDTQCAVDRFFSKQRFIVILILSFNRYHPRSRNLPAGQAALWAEQPS